MKSYAVLLITLFCLGCGLGSVPFKTGNEKLLEWNEQKLRQTFPMQQTMLENVQAVLGPCDFRKLSDDDNASRDLMDKGISMICTYHYVSGKLTNCSESGCYEGVGAVESKEISAQFTFDGKGLLQTFDYKVTLLGDTKSKQPKLELPASAPQ